MVVNRELLDDLILVKGHPEIIEGGLPSWCFIEDIAYGGLIIVEYGQEGYLALRNTYWADITIPPWIDRVDNYGRQSQESERNQVNEVMGVSPAQAEAMMAGSMMGWEVPGAQLSSYWPDGTYKHSRNTMRPTLNNPRGSRLK